MKIRVKTQGLVQSSIVVGLTVVYFFAYLHRIAIPGTIFDELQTAFKVSAGAVAALSVVYFYIYGGVQLFVGSWIDRVGIFKVLIVGGTTLCLGALLNPAAQTMPVLLLSRALMAFGSSLNYICVVKSLDAMFSSRMFPIFLGIIIGIAYAGGLTGTLPFALLSGKFGWRSVLWVIGIIMTAAFVLTASLFFRVKDNSKTQSQAPVWSSIWAVLKNRRSQPVIAVGAINFSVYYLFQATIGKKMLHDLYNLSSATAATFTCIMMVVAVVCMSVSGIISHAIRDRRKPIVMTAISSMVLGGLLLFIAVKYHLSYGWVLLSYCMLGLTSLGSVMNGALMKETNSAELLGTAIGISNGSCYIAAAIFVGLAGFIMDKLSTGVTVEHGAAIYPRETYLLIIAIGTLLLFLSFYLSSRIVETYGEQFSSSDSSV